MTINSINRSQHVAAKVAGFSYLISFAIVVYVNFGIHAPLIVKGNAGETARNILAHERLFRIGIFGDLVYCVSAIILLTALYVILVRVNRFLALLATFWRFVWVLMWLVITLNLFDALRVISDGGYLRVFEADRLQSLASLYLNTSFDYYYVGLLFGALSSIICSYLWFKSRYIPLLLATFGVISSTWCVVCTLLFYIFPNFEQTINLWWFDTPMGIFDIILSFWLLFKGLRPSGLAVSDKSSP